jgi:endonuclease YncB( thermonuclease family)
MPSLRALLLVQLFAAVLAAAPVCAQSPDQLERFPDPKLVGIVPFKDLVRDVTTIAGRASVIDGDALEVRGQRIRLYGVESVADDHICVRTDDERWRCGPRALNALEEFLEESIVNCVRRDPDSLTQFVATCTAGSTDLALWLIRNGLAHAAASAPQRYRQAEAEAKAARRGLWSATGR